MRYNIYEIIRDYETGLISHEVACQFTEKAKKEIEQIIKDFNLAEGPRKNPEVAK